MAAAAATQPNGHDLADLALQLEKATTTQTANVPRAIDILKALQSVTITAAQLQSTGLGRLVNRLRKSADSDIRTLSAAALEHFKRAVFPAGTPSKAKSMTATPATPTAAAVAAAASPSAAAATAAVVAEAANSVQQQMHQRSTSSVTAPASPAGAAAAAASPSDAKAKLLPPVKTMSQSRIDPAKIAPPASPSAAAAAAGTAAAASSSSNSAAAAGAGAGDTHARPLLSVKVASIAGAAGAASAAPASPVATVASPAAAAAAKNGGAAAAAGGPGLLRFPTNMPVTQGHGDFALGLLADAKRNKMQTVLLNALGAQPADAVVPNNELAVRLENALHMKCKGAEYAEQCRSIVFNLKDTNNPELNANLYAGVLDPEMVVEMKPEELASSALKKQREENKQWMKDAARTDWRDKKQAATTDMFRCGKCRERKCSYYQMQTRSADEPMTTFVRCLNCGNRWKC